MIPEPLGGAHHDHVSASGSLKKAVRKGLMELEKLDLDTLLEERYEKFRNFGEFRERGRKKVQK